MRRALTAAGLLALAILLVRTAWVCDDAFITFRVIDNLFHGYGLRWNVAERVQVYTHPLWLLALIPVSAVDGPYYGSMALGAALTLGLAGWLLSRGAASTAMAGAALVALLGSQSFVDFSTSGLENPLAHVLLVATAVRFASLGPTSRWRDRAAVVVLASLAAVNRLDHAILVAPIVLSTLWRAPAGDRLRVLAIGCLPLAGWEAFALVYYGFPLPNTAYAKLATGIPAITLAKQGLQYLATCATWDPLTAVVIALGLAACAQGEPEIGVGIALWLVWLVKIGGDHMAGRFLTPAFALGLLAIVRTERRFPWALAGGFAVLASLAHHPPVRTGLGLLDNQLGPGGIADERAYFYRISGLLRRRIDKPLRRMPGCYEGDDERKKGPHTVQWEMIGWFSHYAGPTIHVVDPLGLGDPLLARIPASAAYFRPGHYKRSVPEGYLAVAADGGHLRDRALDDYWSEVKEVTRGPLFSLERLRDVLDLNRPGPDPRVASWCGRSCSVWREPDIVSLDAPLWLPPLGIGVQLEPERPIRRFLLDAEPGDYRLQVMSAGETAVDLPVAVAEDGRPAVVSFPLTRADRLRLTSVPAGRAVNVTGMMVAPRQ